MLLALLLAALNVGLWWWSNRPNGPADVHAADQRVRLQPVPALPEPVRATTSVQQRQIAADLKLLSRYTHRIRTYDTVQNPQVIRLAKAQGLDVMAGAWIDRRLVHNDEEIDAVVAQARRYPKTVTRVLVGNEVLLRGDIKPTRLMAYLDRARAQIRQPVSTAEPWHIWEKYPELVQHVDFITVHLLPYWEGVPLHDALADAHAALPAPAPDVPEQADRGRRDRLAVQRRPLPLRQAVGVRRGDLPAQLVRLGAPGTTSTTT